MALIIAAAIALLMVAWQARKSARELSEAVGTALAGGGVIILITQIPPLLGYYSGNDDEIVKQMRPQAEQIILNRILEADAHEDHILVIQEFEEALKVHKQNVNNANIMTWD